MGVPRGRSWPYQHLEGQPVAVRTALKRAKAHPTSASTALAIASTVA
jgi:hypothetical protein